MKKIIIGILIVVAIGIIGLAINNGKGISNQDKEPIKIGAVISLTGFAAQWGEESKNAINLAVSEINSDGGINGRLVDVIIEDDHTDAKSAVSAYNKLVNIDKVEGIIGSNFDFPTQPLLPLSLINKITLISPSNFRIAGSFELNEHSFVMLPELNKVIRELEAYIDAVKIKKLAVVHFQSPMGEEIATTLNDVMKERNGEGIIEEEYTQIGGNDFRTIIAKLKSQNPDAVFLDMVGDDPLNFLSQSSQLGFRPKFISYNGLVDAFINEKDKSLMEDVVILNWEVSSDEFISKYKKLYNVEPSKGADKTYDAIYVLSQGIANSKSTSDVASHIESGTFNTPNSTISFTRDHTSATVPVVIQIIKNGIQIPYKLK